MDVVPDSLDGPVAEMCHTFGLPADFHRTVVEEADWSFIIKLNALVETSLNWAIVECTKAFPLEDHVVQLPLLGRCSKVSLAAKLGLIDPVDHRLIKRLAEVRNKLAHNIRNVGFVFADYLRSLPEVEQKAFLADVVAVYEDDTDPSWQKAAISIFRFGPKSALWLNTLTVIAAIRIRTDTKLLEQSKEALAEDRRALELEKLEMLITRVKSEQVVQDSYKTSVHDLLKALQFGSTVPPVTTILPIDRPS